MPNETVLSSVRRILEAEFEIVGVVKDGQSLVAAAQKLKPAVMVVDVKPAFPKSHQRCDEAR
jgi:AmiR/NasT family two-component response regulator